MKVAFITKSLHGGGAEKVCVILANKIAELGVDVTLVSINDNKNFNINNFNVNLKYICCNSERTIFSIRKLSSIIKNGNFNCVLTFGYEIAVVAFLIKLIYRLPVIIIFRNINAISREIYSTRTLYRKFIVRPLIINLIHRVDLIINQCDDMRNDFISFTKCDPMKCITIHNPINLIEINPARNTGNYFLFAGRLELQKQVDHLLHAFKFFCEQPFFRDIRLRICGDGGQRQSLQSLAFQLEIAHRVDFCGYASDLSGHLSGAIATLLTSQYEGFPNILIESIAAGTPVISYDCPTGPREIIQVNENGFLIEYGNISLFSKSMLEVISSPPRRDIVANTAKKFEITGISNQYIQAMKNICLS